MSNAAPGPGPADYPAARIAELAHAMVEAHALGSLPPIVQLGHPVLRMRAAEFEGQLDGELLPRFLAVMRDTMHAAPGVGLAAPQIGIPLRVAVMEDAFPIDPDIGAEREREPLAYFAALNPAYRAAGTRTAAFFEGCLSFDGFQGVVERPAEVAASYTTPEGQAVERGLSGWQARIFQHETDHLDGTVYVDKVLTRSLCTHAEYAARWADPGIGRARRGLGF
jgi:peptide deformylase